MSSSLAVSCVMLVLVLWVEDVESSLMLHRLRQSIQKAASTIASTAELFPTLPPSSVGLPQTAQLVHVDWWPRRNVSLYTLPAEQDWTVSGAIQLHHGFAHAETEIFKRILVPLCARNRHALVVDIGSNLGYFCTLAAVAGCQVLCFEPQPALSSLIVRNLHHNGVLDRALVVNAALGDSNGRVQVVPHPRGLGFGTVAPASSSWWSLRVDGAVAQLEWSSWAPSNMHLALVKMDTEGYEQQVMAGMTRWSEAGGKADHWIVEIKPPRSAALDWLRRHCGARDAQSPRMLSYREVYEARPTDFSLSAVDMSPVQPADHDVPFEDVWMQCGTALPATWDQ